MIKHHHARHLKAASRLKNFILLLAKEFDNASNCCQNMGACEHYFALINLNMP